MVIFGTIHVYLFYWASRYLKATWAELWIDAQVGFSGFGFYFAAALIDTNHSSIVLSMNAGFWTSIVAIVIGIPPIVDAWYMKKNVTSLWEAVDLYSPVQPLQTAVGQIITFILGTILECSNALS